MTYVQSFSAVTPPPRYDAVAWTDIEIWESATEDGSYVLIDTLSIAVDPTPASPNTVQATTTLATLAVGWYKIRFLDGVPNYSNYTDPVLAPADAAYFTVAELRDRFDELTEVDYPDGKVQEAILLALEAFEKAAGVAFTPRTETVTLTGYAASIELPRAKVTSISAISGSTSGSLTVDGQIVGGSWYSSGWAWAAGETLTVTLTHGYATVPPEVRWAVMLLARSWLIRGPSDDRKTQLPTEGGGVINLATPGMFGAEFAIPDVDRVLKQYRRVSLVP